MNCLISVAGYVDVHCDCPESPAVSYGMARLGIFGGGGGISSESGSGGCFRFWAWTAWAQRSTYSKRNSFVTGSWMLLQTAGEKKQQAHKQTHTHSITLFCRECSETRLRSYSGFCNQDRKAYRIHYLCFPIICIFSATLMYMGIYIIFCLVNPFGPI